MEVEQDQVSQKMQDYKCQVQIQLLLPTIPANSLASFYYTFLPNSGSESSAFSLRLFGRDYLVWGSGRLGPLGFISSKSTLYEFEIQSTDWTVNYSAQWAGRARYCSNLHWRILARLPHEYVYMEPSVQLAQTAHFSIFSSTQ